MMLLLLCIVLFLSGVMVGVGIGLAFNELPDYAGTLCITRDENETQLYLQLEEEVESLRDKKHICVSVRNCTRD